MSANLRPGHISEEQRQRRSVSWDQAAALAARIKMLEGALTSIAYSPETGRKFEKEARETAKRVTSS